MIVEPLMQQELCSTMFDQALRQRAQERTGSQCLYMMGGTGSDAPKSAAESFDGRVASGAGTQHFPA